MSPRRSPRFKKSPKPELPKKPRQPKRVENPAEHSVRQTKYQVELAAWEAAKMEHENLMQKRKTKQNAVSKIARESMGGKDSPAPATPPAAARRAAACYASPAPGRSAPTWQPRSSRVAIDGPRASEAHR